MEVLFSVLGVEDVNGDVERLISPHVSSKRFADLRLSLVASCSSLEDLLDGCVTGEQLDDCRLFSNSTGFFVDSPAYEQ